MRAKLVVVVFLFAAISILNGQINRGIVEGVATDPQGAVVPNVEVAVTAVETNVTVTTKTNNTGYYRVTDLMPGRYRATFTLAGFSTIDMTAIEVSAGRITRVDAELRLESTRQTVQVTAEAQLVDTGAANASTTLQTRSIQEVPLQGRDLQQLVFLIPGVNNVGGPPGSNFGFNSSYGTFPDPTNALGSNVAVNGGQGGANAWYLDGNLNLSSFAENVAINPTPDAVQEFQAITNAFAPEYGRTGGGVFNVVLKSGTNGFHGNLYEFLRNDATNARNPFKSVDSEGNLVKSSLLRFNNFGATFGGPVVIPKIYNGRDRTFFFVSWDQTKLRLMGDRVFSVPTARMRNGDFSEDASVANNGLWDPYSTKGPDSNGLFERTAFGTPVSGNPFGDQGCMASAVAQGLSKGVKTCNFATAIPTNLLDPTAMYFMKSFPLPNYNDPLSGCPMGLDGFKVCDNYKATIGSSQDPMKISLKFDHNISDKNHLFLEWLSSPGQYRNYRVPWTGASFPYDLVGFGSNYPVDFSSNIISIGNTYTFRPTLINEFRLGFSRQYMTTHPSSPYPDSITDQKAVQSQLAANKIPSDPFFPTPHFIIQGTGYYTFGPTAWVNMNTGAEAYTLLDNLTKIVGKHTIKGGFMYRLEHSAYESGFPTGFNFLGGLTADPLSGVGGNGLAQFMLGATSNSGRDSNTGIMWQPYERFRYWGFFLQDDFRVTQNFTLNIGARYELFGLYKVRHGPMSNFCLGCPNPDTGLKGKMIYWGDPGWPNGSDIAPAAKNSIGPRINFSWSPFKNRKTVIRGGYDIFYSNALAAINAPGQAASNAPGYNQEYDWNGSIDPANCAPYSGNCVAFRLSDTTTDKGSLTTPPLAKTFPAQQKASLYGSFVQMFTPPPRDPTIQTWNLEIERELPGNMMVDIGYVGNHGTHLIGEAFRQFNFVHTADKLKYRTGINATVPITDYYQGQTAEKLAQIWGSTELQRSILLEDYPAYGGIQNNMAFEGTSIYHGLNVRVEKRYSQGFNFVAAYTYSKKITQSYANLATMLVDPIHWSKGAAIGGRYGANGGQYGGYQDPDNRFLDRSISSDDIPQMLNIAGSYELPFGKGRPLLNRSGLINGVLGGWRVTGSFNAQSGLPLGIGGPCNELTCRPDVVGNPNFSGSRSKQDRINQWMNPAAFAPVFGNDQNFWANYDPNDDRAWRFGTAGPYLPWLRGPGFWNLDSAVAKQFKFSEQRYFEFRWEVFNTLNHQNLANPNTGFCLPAGPNGETDRVRSAGCTFGRITDIQTDPRAMEFTLKFFF